MKINELAGPWVKKLFAALDKYKFVLLVIGLGVLFLLLPDFGGEESSNTRTASQSQAPVFDLEAMEKKMEEALSQIDGAGKVTVVLTVKKGTKQVLAKDSELSQKEASAERTESTVVLSKGSGVQDVVALQEITPEFQGALIVCAGGGSPAVKLKLVEAVSALTGLGSDKISICKGK